MGASIEPHAHAESSLPTPLSHAKENASKLIEPDNLLLYALAAGSTAALVSSGQDWAMRVNTARHANFPAFESASYYGGYALPIVVGPALWLTGLARDQKGLAGAGAAATQAVIYTVVVVGTLKWATGRPFPHHGMAPHDPVRLEHPEFATEFHFFPSTLHNWSYPSGHAASCVAIAASLSAYWNDEAWLPWVTYPLAAGIGAGMVIGEHHWASDVVAGAVIGHAIGHSVGNGFTKTRDDTTASWSVLPVFHGELKGVTLGRAF